MIGIIVIIIAVILIVGSIQEWNRDIKGITELENRLEQYYKERENRLKDNDLIK
jgi:hypothetical protein